MGSPVPFLLKHALSLKARRLYLLISLSLFSSIVTLGQAPSWVAGTPVVPSTGPLTITTNYGINITGTVYIVGYSYVANLPTPASVKSEALAGVAGSRVIAIAIPISAGNVGLTLQTIHNVLLANATHTIFFVAESSSGVLQAAFVRIITSTLACPKIQLFTFFGNLGECVNLGAQGVFQAAPLGILPTGVLKGTTWTVDWGDGSPVWTYTSTADNDIPPAQTHTFTSVTECAYQGSWVVKNPCNEFLAGTSIFVVHGRDIPADGDGLLQMEETSTHSPDIVYLCEGMSHTITVTDISTWNCQNPNVPVPLNPADYDNDKPRTIQFVYGETPAGAIMNTITGNVLIGGSNVANAANGYVGPVITPVPPPNPNTVSETITIPATSVVGQRFYVYLKNWNKCNPYGGNPNVGYEYEDFIIEIIDAPPAPIVVTPQLYCFGSVPVTITATPNLPGNTINWYADAGLTILLGTGTAYAHGQTAPGVYNYWVTETSGVNGCEGPPAQITMRIRENLTRPGPITGPAEVCISAVGQIFSVAANPPVMPFGGPTEYLWTVPAGWNITAGQGSRQITVNIGGTAGTRTVSVVNRYTTLPNCPSPNRDISVTVSPLSVGGSVTGGSTPICIGSSTGTMTLSGNTGNVVRWEKRLGAGAWVNIANTAVTYSETPSAVGSWQYRALVQSGSCSSAYSGTRTIVVDPTASGGTLSGGNTPICLGSATGTMTVAGYSGTISRWERQRNGGGWANIANTNATYSETPALAGTWEYRVRITSGACPAVYSTIRTIVVNPVSVGGSITGGTTPLCLGSATGTMTLSGHTGNVLRWERRLGAGAWVNIANTTTTHSETPASAGSWEYRAYVQSGVCAAVYSGSRTIVVVATSVGGSITGGSTPICPGINTGVMTLAGHTGAILRWEKRVGAGAWSNIANTTTTYSEIPSSSGTWEYRAYVQNSPCAAVYSAVRTIIVRPQYNAQLHDDASICNNTATTFFITLSGGTSPYTINYTKNGVAQPALNNYVNNTPVNTGLLTANTTYVLTSVTDANGCLASNLGTSILITVGSLPTTATLTGSGDACSGASSWIRSVITGGAPPYTINYTRNGVAQAPIAGYTSGSNHDLGILAVGSYTYVITSVRDLCNNPVPAGGLPGPYTININAIPNAAATVNNAPVICNNGTTAIVLHSDVPTSDFIWTVSNAPATTWTAGKAPAGGTRVNGENYTIAQNLEHNGTQPITVTYTITPRGPGATACLGTPITRDVVVNPAGQVNDPANQTVCNGANTAAVNFSTNRTGGVTTYAWTNNTPGIGLPASGNGNIAAFAAVNNGTSPVTATITVTPTFTNGTVSCAGPAENFTITVNPTAQVNDPADQTVCNGANTAAVTFGTNRTGGTTTYAWTNNTPGIGLPASGNGNIATFAAVNNGTSPVTATITVTPTFTNNSVGCTGPAETFTITVNPSAQVNDPANQTVCNGLNTTAVTFGTNRTGGVTTYSWVNNTPGIGLPASGNGNIAAFAAINNGTSPVTATITVTPTFTNNSVGCTGTAQTFTITVNPTAQVNDPANQTVCNASNTTTVTFGTNRTGGVTTYSWTNDTPGIGLPASGNGNIAAFAAVNNGTSPVTATITVTPTFTNNTVGCTGPAESFTITVNPTAQVTDPGDQAVCNNTATTAVNFVTTRTGGATTYAWTNSNTGIGLPASGVGNIPSFTAVNAGNSPVLAIISVTPTFTNNSVACTGPAENFTITVNPTPTLSSTLTPAAVCSNTVFSYTPTSATAGTTFNWTRAVVAGITPAGPASGANNPLETLINITSAPINVTYEYTLLANGCSNVQNVVVSVKPEPVISNQATSVCSGNAMNYQILLDNFINPGGNVTFTWPLPILSAGVTGGSARGSASSANITDTFTNTSGGIGTATFHVTPFRDGCAGTPKDIVVTVGSEPVLDPGLNDIVCSNTPTGLILKEAAGSVTPSHYNIISITVETGLNPASGNAIIPETTAPATFMSSDIFTNLTGVNKTVTYRVQPVLAPDCFGDPVDVVITIRPQPVIVPGQTKTVCSGVAIGREILLIPANTPAGTIFNWNAPLMSDASGQGTAGVNVAADPAGTIHINDIINNLSSAPITATYAVTPTSSFGCAGDPVPVIITINQEPVPQPISGRINLCVGDKNVVYNVNPVGGSSFHWTVAPAVGTKTFDFNTNAILIDAALAAGSGNISVYETNSLGCSGDPSNLLVTVYTQPAPENIIGDAVVCAMSTHTYNVTNRVGSVYNWTIPGGAAIIGNPSASSVQIIFGNVGGTILVRETNIAGCVTNHNPFAVTVNPLPTAIISNGGNMCDGGTRPLSVAFAGTAPFSFTYAINGVSQAPISTSDNPYIISATLAGTYTIVNVTDNTGCTNTGSGSTTITYFPKPTGIISGGGELCRGSSATLTMTFTGVAPFTFTYTDGTTPVTVTAHPNNVYTVSVSPLITSTYTLTSLTDFNSCVGVLSGSALINVNQPPSLSLTGTNLICYNVPAGAVDMIISGGTAPFGIAWTGPNGFTSPTEDISGLNEGYYAVTVSDSKGCIATANITLTQPPVLNGAVARTNVTCFNSNDAAITISGATGGTGTYEYSINGGTTWQGSGIYNGLAPGTYNVQIRDLVNPTCILTLNPALVITQPPILSATVTKTDITCFGANNGSIIISGAAGGYGTYQYTINGGTNWVGSGNFTNLTPGTYNVQIRDAVNTACVLVLNAALVVTEPPVITATVSRTNITCFGSSDGTISITAAAGGHGTYEYSINGGGSWQATGTYTGLTPGTYNVQIRDAAFTGCYIVLNNALVLTQPAVLTATVGGTAVTCSGANDGTISITGASGGYGTYEYTINGGTNWFASGLFINLAPGTYDVRIRDAANTACVIILNAGLQITEPAALMATVVDTDISCFGANNGIITITNSAGGYGTYQYSINGGSTWQDSPVFSSLSAGSYDVRIRDRAHTLCVVTLNPAVLITEPAALAAVLTNSVITCYGSNDGTITISSPTGGYGSYQYSINGGASWQGSASFTGLAPGTYNVRMRDALNPACLVILNPALVITEPLILSATVARTNVTCFGAADGTITINGAAGGYGTYEYTINGGATWQASGNFTLLNPGFYNVKIRDAAHIACIITLNASLQITEPAVLSANVARTNVTCFGANDGSITITNPLGGYGTYEYSINGGGAWQASGTFINLAPATYNVQIRDAAHPACIIILNGALVITGPAALSATVTNTNVTCFGANNGTIAVSNPTGGWGTYQYSVNGGTTWSAIGNFTSLAPGTYDVRMRDAAYTGCFVILNPALVITQPAVLNATLSSINVTCFGATDGSITITNPTGGYGTYEYTVNGGGAWQASGSFTGLGPGTYNVQIRDAAYPACIIVLNNALLITQPAILKATVTPTMVTCNGAADGIISITAPSGGFGTYEYSVNGGTSWQASGTFNGLAPGLYDVRIRDAVFITCEIVLNPGVTITEPAIMNAVVASTDVTCFGANDGVISITSPTGGYGTYEFSKDGGATWQLTGTFASLAPDSYDVRIRDRAHPSCEIVLNPALVINQPAVLSATVASADITCNGANDGIINITNPLGGYGTYSYTINGGASWQTTGTFTSLAPGTYNVRIRDAAHITCEIILNPALLITQPAKLTATVGNTNVTCYGANDGTITITAPAGGYGTYEYTIDGGTAWQASGNFAALAPGFYNVQIRDAAHPMCIVTLNGSLRITEPPQLAAAVGKTDVTCFGANDGRITISGATGGYGTYEYSISGGASWQASGTFNGLTPGSFNVQIRDAAHTGCIIVLNSALVITEPSALSATVTGTNVTCFGANNGIITIAGAAGGYGTYEYSINGGTNWSGLNNFTNLAPGTYDVRMRDAAHTACTTILNAALTITQPAVLKADVARTNVTCFGGSDGTITITNPTGGYGTFEYSINGGGSWQASGIFTALVPGNYNVQIRDAAHISCVIILDNSLQITQPPMLNAVVLTTMVTCNGANDGIITITNPTGGYGTYEYSINAGGSWQLANIFSNLAPGTYDVRIRDASNIACTITLNPALVITEPAILNAVVTGVNVTCFGANNGMIIITSPTGGYGTYDYSHNGGAAWQTSATFSSLAPGTYDVRIRDRAHPACVIILNAALIITEPAALTATVTPTMITCNGANDGIITITNPLGGYGTYSFTINGGATWQSSGTFNYLAPATYNVRIRDAANIACEIVLDPALVITQSAKLAATVGNTNVTCYGANDGTITINSPTGGYGTYEYSINGGLNWQAGGSFTALAPGFYNVQIRDAAHPLCVVILNGSLRISEPPVLTANVSRVNVTCNGANDGTITITSPMGGYGTYEYSITGGGSWQLANSFSNLAPGSYDVRIRDAAQTGCVIVLNPALVITEPAQLAAIVGNTNVTCFGANDGTISISNPTGGYGIYQYSISGGTTWQGFGNFTNLIPGTYDVRIRDAANISCVITLNPALAITQPAVLAANIASTNVSCFGGNDGTITISGATGGYGTYEYSINGGGSWQASGSFSGLTPGSYNILIRDAAHTGCIIVLNNSYIITQPVMLSATISKTDVSCNGDNDGTISITAPTGGYGTYEYSIDGGGSWQVSGSYTNLTPGSYDIRIRDAAHPACSVILYPNLLITEPLTLTMSSTGDVLLDCFGDMDAMGTFFASGGTMPYTFLVVSNTTGGTIAAPGFNSQTFFNAGAGSITVQVVDFNGCSAQGTINITQPAALNAGTIAANQVVCYGDNPAMLTETSAPNGGTGTYNFQWQSSTNIGGPFINIAGANANQYTPQAGATYTLYYRRMVTSGICMPVYSNVVEVLVNPRPVAFLTGGATICPAESSVIRVTMLAGTGPFTVEIANLGTINNYISGADIVVTPAVTTVYSLVRVRDANNCEVVAPSPNLNGTATVIVSDLPVITSFTPSPAVCEFTLASFRVTATGTNLTYQWFVDEGSGIFNAVVDGGTYFGAMTPTLQIFNTVRTMNGFVYHVVVSGCGTDVTSADATFTVNTVPEITLHPKDSTICLGQNAVMEADATGTNVTWQWYVNKGSGFVVSVDDAYFSGSATKTLTITNAQAIHNNWVFRAVATGICGVPVNTNFAILRVVNPPAVTLAPVAAIICENGSTSFLGNGTGYTSLQWQVFSGGVWSNLADNATYIGTNTQQLAIMNAPVGLDGNQYRLALITGCATTYTNGVTLSVNANPVVDFSAIDPIPACGDVPIIINGNPSGGSGVYTQHRWTGDVGPLSSYTVQSPTFNSLITGTYNLNYRVTDSNGCTANDDVAVTVDSPSAQFTQDADYGCTPLTVTFTKDMTGISKWWWNFDDGSPLDSLNANPVHTFVNSVPGSIEYFDVTLKVRSTGGCFAEFTSTITVYPSVDATFTPNVAVVCSGNSITFTALSGASRYFWEYGDGVSGYATNVSTHLYTNFTTAPVVRTVRLTTTSFYNCSDVKTFDITVMPVPIPQFTAAPLTQVFNAAGNPVTFTNTTNAGTWSWLWNFGDNTTSTDENPVHSYTGVGTYTVTLIANNANCSDSVKHNVSVVPPAPVASFDSIPSGCAPLYVNINNTSLNTEVPGTTYLWDFGDGSKSTAKNPTYTYFTEGTYRIELVVTGPGGTSMATQVVNAYPSPKAYFEVTPPMVYVNDERIRCFNLSQGATSYLWDFGDGDTSKVKEPYHRYMEEGVFDITLWAYSDNGCTDMYVLSPAVTVEPVGELRFATVFQPNKTGPIERTDLPTGGTEIDQFFYPPIRQKVLNYKLQIFNRLGVLIFESHDINVPWNGYYKGKLCQQGVYVWYVEGKYADGKPFKMVGNVTLLQ